VPNGITLIRNDSRQHGGSCVRFAIQMATPHLAGGPRTRRPLPGDNRALLFGDRPSTRAPIPGTTELAAAETELLETRNGASVDTLRDRVGDMRHVRPRPLFCDPHSCDVQICQSRYSLYDLKQSPFGDGSS
jgi:hypothetical protein